MKKYIVLFSSMICIHASLSYAEKINTHEAKRTSIDVGSITVVKTDANQDGQTKLSLDRCFHQGIGNLKNCTGNLYKIDESTGWLDKEKVMFSNEYLDFKTIILPAGKYYIKMGSSQAGKTYYTTGEVSITPFVTNFVHVELK